MSWKHTCAALLKCGLSCWIAVGVSFAAVGFSPASTALAADGGKVLTEIHFNPGSTDVTPGGEQKIQEAIAAIKAQNPREIHVIGFTDSTGDEATNQAIARNRANNVASLLTERGIAVPMVIEGKGEDGAPYKIPDNVSEPLNRCVGIIAIGPSSVKPTL